MKNAALLLVTIVLCLLSAEYVVRSVDKNRLYIQRDERNLAYRYDSLLGWFPIAHKKIELKRSRLIHISNNSRGFRDDEHVITDNPRIVFLGDSYVWGFDVEKSERFTEKLRKLTDWSVYNLGVSGYGTDQEYLLLQQQYDYYKPDVVFLVYCTGTDREDNIYSKRYWGYYKPYFVLENGGLGLRGTPVPKSENYFFVKHEVLSQSYLVRLIAKQYFQFKNPPRVKAPDPTLEIIRKIHQLTESKGSKLFVGVEKKYPKLERFLKQMRIPYVDLSTTHRYPEYGAHWTPEGHTIVANRIYQFLIDNRVFTKP